jgi:hypothetical protein
VLHLLNYQFQSEVSLRLKQQSTTLPLWIFLPFSN